MPKSKTKSCKPKSCKPSQSIEETFYLEQLNKHLSTKELQPIKKKIYRNRKIECKAYKDMLTFINQLDQKFDKSKMDVRDPNKIKKVLKQDIFIGSGFQTKIKQLHNNYVTANNNTASISQSHLKSIPLETTLEELPIATNLNNIRVNQLNEPAPKKKLNIHDCTCDISNISNYSSSVLLL